MDNFGYWAITLLLLGVGVAYAIQASRAAAIRQSALQAMELCLDEIESLRGGIMAGITENGWCTDRWERRRQDLLIAADRFYSASIGATHNCEALRRGVPSFQDEADWAKWKILARGPYPRTADDNNGGV